SPSGTGCGGVTNNRSIFLPSLGAGGTASITFFTKLNFHAATRGQLSNTAPVPSSTSGPAPPNDTPMTTLSLTSVTSTISPLTQAFDAAGGFGSVKVLSTSSCGWTAKSNDNFITITDAGSGIGNGVVRYFVAANTTGAQRTGTLAVAGQTFTVTQAAGAMIAGPRGTPSALRLR